MMMMDPLVEMSFVALLLLGSLLGSFGVKQNFPMSYQQQQQQPPPRLQLLHSRDDQGAIEGRRRFQDEVTRHALTLTHSTGHLRKHLNMAGDGGGHASSFPVNTLDDGDRSPDRGRLLSPGDFHQVTSPPHSKKFSYHRVVEERGGSRPYAAVTLEQDDDLLHHHPNHPLLSTNHNQQHTNHHPHEDFKEREALEESPNANVGAVGRSGRHLLHHHHHQKHFHHIHHNHNHHHHQHHHNSYHHRRSHFDDDDEDEGIIRKDQAK